ncbi:MAG: ABATE domain-containing protein [Ilumatobacteraceae bacterium]
MNARDPAAAPPNPLLAAQAAGFPVGGEPLAIDLADTLITSSQPPADLLAGEGRLAAFWELQHPRLPPGSSVPSLAATLALRDAVRSTLDAIVQDTPIDPLAIERINVASAGAVSWPLLTTSPRMELGTDDGWRAGEGAALSLAAVARSLIEVVTGPAVGRLRRCANPSCSMLFIADDARRKWCTTNICGNRARVARHYQRSREAAAATPAESD